MFIPVFPLQLVVFPGEELKLHIFEPRYKELTRECQETGQTFAIPAYFDDGLAPYGTEMELVDVFRRYDSGEMDVLTRGVGVVKLEKFVREVPGKLYSGAEVVRMAEEPGSEARDSGPDREAVVDLYRRLRTIFGAGDAPHDLTAPLLSYQLAHEVGFTMQQKVQLLAMPRESERLQAVAHHLEQIIPVIEAAEESKQRIGGNGKVHHFPELDL